MEKQSKTIFFWQIPVHTIGDCYEFPGVTETKDRHPGGLERHALFSQIWRPEA